MVVNMGITIKTKGHFASLGIQMNNPKFQKIIRGEEWLEDMETKNSRRRGLVSRLVVRNSAIGLVTEPKALYMNIISWNIKWVNERGK